MRKMFLLSLETNLLVSPIFWLGGGPPGDDDDTEEGDELHALPPPMRRTPCAFCNGKGWYWELLTSSRSFQP